jgi:uncharacterized protein HemX
MNYLWSNKEAMLQLLAIVVVLVASTSITAAYAQDVNDTQEQKPTEEKQGGEYSGFEEARKQTEGIPNQDANPTPQAPISDLNVQQENQTTTVDTTGPAAERASVPGVATLAGVGGIIAVVIGAAVWYFKRGRR